MPYHPLTATIIGCAMKVHSTLGPGFLESVYQNALVHELLKSKLRVVTQHPVPVIYDGINVGDFVADLVVNEIVIVELKAIHSLTTSHEVQLVNYLSATGLEIGLLLNFGATSLQFKRKHRTFVPKPRTLQDTDQKKVDF
jgi:GxxExxY protein